MKTLQDRLDIQDLCNLYAFYIDSFLVEEWTNCFTSNAVFDETDLGNGVFHGYDAIKAFGEKLVTRVHLVIHLMSNHIIWDLAPATARGTSFAVVETTYANGERYRFHCRYTDSYQKVDGVWKFAERVAQKTFAREGLGIDPNVTESVA